MPAADRRLRVAVSALLARSLARDIARFSLADEYGFASGHAMTAEGGVNELRARWIRCLGVTPPGYWCLRDPQDPKDESHEIRRASRRNERLTPLVGYHSEKQAFIQWGSGGGAIWLWCGLAPRPVGSPCAGVNCPATRSLAQNTGTSTTEVSFASIDGRLEDQLSASLEGLQHCDETRRAVFTSTPARIGDEGFQPRFPGADGIIRREEFDMHGIGNPAARLGQPVGAAPAWPPGDIGPLVASVPAEPAPGPRRAAAQPLPQPPGGGGGGA